MENNNADNELELTLSDSELIFSDAENDITPDLTSEDEGRCDKGIIKGCVEVSDEENNVSLPEGCIDISDGETALLPDGCVDVSDTEEINVPQISESNLLAISEDESALLLDGCTDVSDAEDNGALVSDSNVLDAASDISEGEMNSQVEGNEGEILKETSIADKQIVVDLTSDISEEEIKSHPDNSDESWKDNTKFEIKLEETDDFQRNAKEELLKSVTENFTFLERFDLMTKLLLLKEEDETLSVLSSRLLIIGDTWVGRLKNYWPKNVQTPDVRCIPNLTMDKLKKILNDLYSRKHLNLLIICSLGLKDILTSVTGDLIITQFLKDYLNSIKQLRETVQKNYPNFKLIFTDIPFIDVKKAALESDHYDELWSKVDASLLTDLSQKVLRAIYHFNKSLTPRGFCKINNLSCWKIFSDDAMMEDTIKSLGKVETLSVCYGLQLSNEQIITFTERIENVWSSYKDFINTDNMEIQKIVFLSTYNFKGLENKFPKEFDEVKPYMHYIDKIDFENFATNLSNSISVVDLYFFVIQLNVKDFISLKQDLLCTSLENHEPLSIIDPKLPIINNFCSEVHKKIEKILNSIKKCYPGSKVAFVPFVSIDLLHFQREFIFQHNKSAHKLSTFPGRTDDFTESTIILNAEVEKLNKWISETRNTCWKIFEHLPDIKETKCLFLGNEFSDSAKMFMAMNIMKLTVDTLFSVTKDRSKKNMLEGYNKKLEAAIKANAFSVAYIPTLIGRRTVKGLASKDSNGKESDSEKKTETLKYENYPKKKSESVNYENYPKKKSESVNYENYPKKKSESLNSENYPKKKSESVNYENYPKKKSESVNYENYPKKKSESVNYEKYPTIPYRQKNVSNNISEKVTESYRESVTYYKSSHSPIRKIRSRSRSSSTERDRKKSRNTLVQQLTDKLWERHQTESKAYRLVPSSHPDFQKERDAYMDKVAQDMATSGIYPKPEEIMQRWNAFWMVRLEEILNDAWVKRRTESLSIFLNATEGQTRRHSRTRSRSPKYRKRSPLKHSRSPSRSGKRHKRRPSYSPRRSRSPRKRSHSPYRYKKRYSPVHKNKSRLSPVRISRKTRSPERKRNVSPVWRTYSPKRKSKSPERRNRSKRQKSPINKWRERISFRNYSRSPSPATRRSSPRLSVHERLSKVPIKDRIYPPLTPSEQTSYMLPHSSTMKDRSRTSASYDYSHQSSTSAPSITSVLESLVYEGTSFTSKDTKLPELVTVLESLSKMPELGTFSTYATLLHGKAIEMKGAGKDPMSAITEQEINLFSSMKQCLLQIFDEKNLKPHEKYNLKEIIEDLSKIINNYSVENSSYLMKKLDIKSVIQKTRGMTKAEIIRYIKTNLHRHVHFSASSEDINALQKIILEQHLKLDNDVDSPSTTISYPLPIYPNRNENDSPRPVNVKKYTLQELVVKFGQYKSLLSHERSALLSELSVLELSDPELAASLRMLMRE